MGDRRRQRQRDCPWRVPHDLNRALLDETDRGRELLMRTPMRRFGDVGEVAGAAVLLASDAASFITGQCIVVDGGFLASARQIACRTDKSFVRGESRLGRTP